MIAERGRLARLPSLSRFGRYELLGRLAAGGMAEIFLAREPSIVESGVPRHLVIKRMLAQVAGDPTFVEMFLDEARLAMRLRHPAIVHAYELGEQDGSYFLAMEWVDGAPLGKLIRRAREVGGIPAPIAVKIGASVAEALEYAHTLRDDDGTPLHLVHRDVSPQNVMVSYDGAVKLLDFGIAHSVERRSKTQQGQVRGKLAYMSPQQCMGEPIDHRADVFALGVCLWEALRGQPLFHRHSQYETMRAVVELEAPPLDDLSPELDAIVRRALNKDVEQRFSSAGELQVALERWLASRHEVVTTARISDMVHGLIGAERGPVDSSRFGDSLPPPAAPIASPLPPRPSPLPPPGLSTEPLSLSDVLPETDERPVAESARKRALPWGAIAFAVLLLIAAVGLGSWLAFSVETGAPEAQTESTRIAAGPALVAPGPPPFAPIVPAPPQTTELPQEADSITGPEHRGPRRGEPVRRRRIEPPPTPAAEPAPEPFEAGEASVRDEASVSINTRPWSKVYLGSRLIGTTPIGRAAVPSGPLRFRIVDRDGREHQRELEVSPGGHERVFFDLDAP